MKIEKNTYVPYGLLAGGAAGVITGYKIGDMICNKIENDVLKKGATGFVKKIVDELGIVKEGPTIALAMGIGAVTIVGGAYLGAKIGEYIDNKKSEKINYDA